MLPKPEEESAPCGADSSFDWTYRSCIYCAASRIVKTAPALRPQTSGKYIW